MSEAWSVPYGRYEEAFKAIHSALSGLMVPPSGRKITRVVLTWYADKTLESLKVYDGSDLIFTLSFVWDSDGTLKEVART